jgi:hypothetical protein
LTIKSGLFFGLGPAKITVNLWVKEDKITKTLNGFVFGPFVILKD